MTAEKVKIIQDIIGPTKNWKPNIRQLFFKTTCLTYFERFLLVNFAYVNGLSLDIFIDWLDHRKLLKTSADRNRIIQLYQQYESGNYNDHEHYDYYSYNVAMDRWQYIDGTTRNMDSRNK